jgi:hypothetical protein
VFDPEGIEEADFYGAFGANPREMFMAGLNKVRWTSDTKISAKK